MRVASIPAGHVYVRHLSSPQGDDVVRLADPPRPDAPAGAAWWPPAMLAAEWVDAHADEFDLAHLHFGFDAIAPADLGRFAGALRERRRPLVYTVHDLRNPHHADRRAHDVALDVLVPLADALITLTPGAAHEIRERWGREAEVIPHPHVVPLELLDAPRPERDRPRIGLHLKSLRANMAALPMLDLLVEEVPARGLDLVVDVHVDVLSPQSPNHNAEVTAELARICELPGIEVHVHDYYDDAELRGYLQGLDLSVLPYRFGSHSGWLEACYDLGTRVLAPHVGFYHEQHPGVLGFRYDADGAPVRADVVAALDAIIAPAAPWQATRLEREAQRRSIALRHLDLYDRVLEPVRA